MHLGANIAVLAIVVAATATEVPAARTHVAASALPSAPPIRGRHPSLPEPLHDVAVTITRIIRHAEPDLVSGLYSDPRGVGMCLLSVCDERLVYFVYICSLCRSGAMRASEMSMIVWLAMRASRETKTVTCQQLLKGMTERAFLTALT